VRVSRGYLDMHHTRLTRLDRPWATLCSLPKSLPGSRCSQNSSWFESANGLRLCGLQMTERGSLPRSTGPKRVIGGTRLLGRPKEYLTLQASIARGSVPNII
jgi:hypothetical protein